MGLFIARTQTTGEVINADSVEESPGTVTAEVLMKVHSVLATDEAM